MIGPKSWKNVTELDRRKDRHGKEKKVSFDKKRLLEGKPSDILLAIFFVSASDCLGGDHKPASMLNATGLTYINL